MNTAAPLAIIRGESIQDAPAALHIPPAALRVVLSEFEGPLDLLLFLVRKHKFDILDIPMTSLCRQYNAYVEEILSEDSELAADYLTMSALLIEIKTRMLLPRPPAEEEDEEDPRAQLMQKLLEYERLRRAAEALGGYARRGNDFFSPHLKVDLPPLSSKPRLQSGQLAAAFAAVLRRLRAADSGLAIAPETISVREVMTNLLRRLAGGLRLKFQAICQPRQGGVTFLALLQMAFERLVHLEQTQTPASGQSKQSGQPPQAQDDISIQIRREPHDNSA